MWRVWGLVPVIIHPPFCTRSNVTAVNICIYAERKLDQELFANACNFGRLMEFYKIASFFYWNIINSVVLVQPGLVGPSSIDSRFGCVFLITTSRRVLECPIQSVPGICLPGNKVGQGSQLTTHVHLDSRFKVREPSKLAQVVTFVTFIRERLVRI